MWVLGALAEIPDWLFLGLVIGAVLTVFATVAFLIGELFVEDGGTRGTSDRVDGDERRSLEIRQYLETIEEPYRQGHRIDGHEVDFYLTERDVAITFDAHTFFELDDSHIHMILWEYEMPASKLGNRLPFETPDLASQTAPGSTTAPTTPPETETAFRELGLRPDADPQRVQSAYRRRVKDVHPDHGGDEETFKRVQNAYATAKEYSEARS